MLRPLFGDLDGFITCVNVYSSTERDYKGSKLAKQTCLMLLYGKLVKMLRLYPYATGLEEELKVADHETRRTFALTFVARVEIDIHCPWKIVWGDEALFCQDEPVNAHNCRIREF
ncbi:hypothetical protein CEXT_733121 [Caerostris extrusa]|uniref:Uncharacterized protein n=1 Tax=Caerostris extrusa TaxID=172846 RepID=A0AAV4QY95_CAEEX|nr:hypothetical protein CEXT_733121 [Caerostris extrusa]